MTTLRLTLLAMLALTLPVLSAPVQVLPRDLVHAVNVPAVVAAPAAEGGCRGATPSGPRRTKRRLRSTSAPEDTEPRRRS